jgi:hypothetical protein
MASPNVLHSKPLLLDVENNRFPEDIVIKINNIICDDYIKRIYEALEKNLIKNIIKIFLNDKNLARFLYYYGYQTYYFNNIMTENLGIYGEPLYNFEWGDFECDISQEDYAGITEDTREPYILNMPSDVVFDEDNSSHTHNNGLFNNGLFNNGLFNFYKYDANIFSKILTLNETLWILKNYTAYDTRLLRDINEYDYDTYADINDDAQGDRATIANFEIDANNTFENIYDYDKEPFAIAWNLFNRGFNKLNIFKMISVLCYNTDIDNVIQQYYGVIGGTGSVNVDMKVNCGRLFRKTCYNVLKYFNKKIEKAVSDTTVISYLYAIYADDAGIQFDEEHEEHENKAYDILQNKGLLKTKRGNMLDILELLYELYLR